MISERAMPTMPATTYSPDMQQEPKVTWLPSRTPRQKIADANERMETNAERLMRRASQNCARLTGKPNL